MAAREPPPPPPAPAEPDAAGRYEAVAPHWFYRKVTDTRERWVPFSAQDSERLEEAHGSGRERPPRAAERPRAPPPLRHRRPAAPAAAIFKLPFGSKYLFSALKIAARDRPGGARGEHQVCARGRAGCASEEIPRARPRLPGFSFGNAKLTSLSDAPAPGAVNT